MLGYRHRMIWLREYPWVETSSLQFLLHWRLQTWEPVSIQLRELPLKVFQNRMHLSAVPATKVARSEERVNEKEQSYKLEMLHRSVQALLPLPGHYPPLLLYLTSPAAEQAVLVRAPSYSLNSGSVLVEPIDRLRALKVPYEELVVVPPRCQLGLVR